MQRKAESKEKLTKAMKKQGQATKCWQTNNSKQSHEQQGKTTKAQTKSCQNKEKDENVWKHKEKQWKGGKQEKQWKANKATKCREKQRKVTKSKDKPLTASAGSKEKQGNGKNRKTRQSKEKQRRARKSKEKQRQQGNRMKII
jgi:hypothetical protein